VLSTGAGTIGPDTRIEVTIDWDRAPGGSSHGTIKVAGAGAEVAIDVPVFNPAAPRRDAVRGFVEGEGVVSIEAEHFTANLSAGVNRWLRIEDYGRTLSGLRADGPADAPPATPGTDSPCLTYDLYTFDTGDVDVTAILSPTLNFVPGRDLRYAISFDDEPPQTVVAVPHDFPTSHGQQRLWSKLVADNARLTHSHHLLARPGAHTLKVWMVDPGVVLTKLVVNFGGLKPSYLGPPESFRGPAH
jgi:hypothetical protein